MTWARVSCAAKSTRLLPSAESSSSSCTLISTKLISVKPSFRSNSSQIYSGARQMTGNLGSRTEVISGGGSAAPARGYRRKPATPVADSAPRTRRRVCIVDIVKSSLRVRHSRLQLAFQLVQKAPIASVGDNLLRGRLDQPGL